MPVLKQSPQKLLVKNMQNNIVSLTKKLIRIKSATECLEIAISQLNNFTIERFEKNGVKSALIYNTTNRPKKFKIILNGHLDVIPGKEYQYAPKIKNNRLYGVGAMDMKANVICLISVFKTVANRVKYPLALQLVTDEEPGGFNGTKYQIDEGVRADFVIAGETTNFNIVNTAKGILWLKISTTGKTAHGAYPWKGKNAIWEMEKFLALLGKKFPIPNKQKWITTINLSNIKTNNQTFNKIPDECEVWLDIRYVPEKEKTILNSIKKMLPQGFSLKIIEQEPPLLIDENNKYIKMLRKITTQTLKKKIIFYGAQGSSDARHFTKVGCSGIEFGPIGQGIGSDNEYVDIPSLKQYSKILINFLLAKPIKLL